MRSNYPSWMIVLRTIDRKAELMDVLNRLYVWFVGTRRNLKNQMVLENKAWWQVLGLIPNTLSFIRLFWGMWIVIVELPPALYDGSQPVVFLGMAMTLSTEVAVKLLIVFVTDLLDGMAARHLGSKTRFGEILDTLVDKIVFVWGLCVIVVSGHLWFGWWTFGIMAFREVIVAVMRPFVKSMYDYEMGVDLLGKIKFGFQCAAVIAIVWISTRGPISDIVTMVALALTVASLVRYAWKAWLARREFFVTSAV